MFFFTLCLVHKFGPHIPVYQLGPCRFMTKKNCERGQNVSRIFRVISKGLYENETVLKSSMNGEFSSIKRHRMA